jgi:hypothetical protein
LVAEFGKGLSQPNLSRMTRFAEAYTGERPMTRILAILMAVLSALVLTAGTTAQDGKPKSIVKPSSLHVMRGRSDLKLFGPGQTFSDQIHVELIVTVPGRELLRVDDESKLPTFADDKANSLIDAKAFRPVRFSASVLSLDRASMMVVVVRYDRAPDEGSAKVHVKGDLVMAYGLESKSAEANADLNAKGDQKVGELALKLDPGKQTPNGFYIDLLGEARSVRTITAVGADGKEVKMSAAYSIPVNKGPRVFTYYVPKANSEIKLKVVYYNKEEKITVPVDLAIGAGL